MASQRPPRRCIGTDSALAVAISLLLVVSSVAPAAAAGLEAPSADGSAAETLGGPATVGETQLATDWPTDGHDATRSGHDPNATGPATDVDARWVFESHDSVRHEPAVVADGRVFVPTRDGLRVLDNETGEELWNVTERAVDRVSVAEGVAVVATSGYNEESIRAYDAASGTELWNETDFEARSSVLSDGTVYVERYYDNVDEVRLYAFDLHSGDERWSVHHADDVGGGLAADGDTVYATWKLSDTWNREFAVFALDAANGEERWRFELEGRISMTPVVVNDTVYVGGGGEVVFDGDSYDPKFYALNASDGHVEWMYDAHARPNGAAVADDTVYVAMGNGIHALDGATGERQWVHRMAGDIEYGLWYTTTDANPPSVADGVVYATNDRGFVDALDGDTGDVLWTYRVEGEATRPAIADDRVYVHATVPESGENVVRVYALETEPFAFSGLTASATTAAPGEEVTVSVTVENVDDEVRAYNLSLMADGVLPTERRAVDTANGTLAPSAVETVTFSKRFNVSGSWNLSIDRALERDSSIGPVTVDVVHSPSIDDWPTRGFDRGATHSNPDTAGPKRHVQERWNVSGFDDDTEPVVSDGTVYVVRNRYRSGQPNVYSLATYDFESGTPGWEYNFTAENRAPVGSATVEGDTAYVYATSRFLYDDAPDPMVGTVYAFDTADGSVTWSKDIPLNRSITADQAPVVADGLVYVTGAITEENPDNANASVYALDAATGGVHWTHTVGERSELEYFYPPAFADGTLYVSLSDQDEPHTSDYTETIVAIDASGGNQVWETSPTDLDQTKQLVARDGVVYAIDRAWNGDGELAEELVAYDVSDGSERWRFTPPNVTTPSYEYDQWRLYKPVVTENAVFIGQQETASGNLYKRMNRVNASTGELEWRRGFSDRSLVAVVDGLVYASGDNDLTAIYDAVTGEYLSRTDYTSGANGAVRAVADGTAFGTTDQGQTLRALSEGGAFEFTDLAVDSERLGLGENVTVTATVTNVGNLERSWNANLIVSPNSDRQSHHIWNYPSRDGTLAPGQSETITWKVELRERGDYVFTLQPNYENSGMSAYLDDLTDGVTASVGDDRDGQIVPFVGPREMPADADSWPKESFDAGNTGNNTGTGAPTAVGGDVANWSVNHSYEWTSGPTLANDTVFVGGNHVSGGAFVYAYDATDGELRWQYLTYGASDVEVPPTYAGGYVYTAASDGRVYQFDAATGERLWTYNGMGDVGGITVVGDVAYVAGDRYENSNDVGGVHALNASTREVLWTFEKVSSDYGMGVKPAVEDGTVYVTSDDGYTYALDATTGEEVWSQPIAGTGSSLHSPVVEDGVVYVDDAAWNSDDASLYALDAADGSIIWDTPANVDGYTGSSPVLADDTLYFVADGSVRAVDATDGSARWDTAICSAGRYSPAYADGTLYVPTTDHAIRAYDGDTGDLVWRYDGHDEQSFTPAVVDGLLYATGLENSDGIYSLVALEGGHTDQPKTLFDFSNLVVSNEAVATGESFTVSATVENQGDAACSYTADLMVNGSVEDTTTGSLGGDSYNDDDTVEFTHSFASAGTYSVTIEDLPPVEVTVTEAPEPQPDVDVTPSSWDYGTAEVDEWVHKDFEVRNLGQGDLHWTDSVITGPDADEFSITSDDSTKYGYLWWGGSGYVRVYLTSETPGPKTATLEIHTDDPDEPIVNIPLTATVEAGPQQVQVAPTTLDFGDVTVGSTAEMNVTVENVGDSALSFDGVTLGSSEFGSFAVVAGDAPLSLAPGESHEVTVAFAPPLEDSDATTLTVNTDDPNDPAATVSLVGNGAASPQGQVNVVPTYLDFGSVPVDSTVTANVTVSNDGGAALTYHGVEVPESSAFALVAGNESVTLAPGEFHEFTVAFAPTSVATGGDSTEPIYSGESGESAVESEPSFGGGSGTTLDVLTDDPDQPRTSVFVTGTGVDASPPTVAAVNVTGSYEADETVYANETVGVAVNATDQHGTVADVTVALVSTASNFVQSVEVTYDSDSGNWTGALDLPADFDDGRYVVWVRATDDSGNPAVVAATETVVADRAAPRLAATLAREDAANGRVNVTAAEPLRDASVTVEVEYPDGSTTTLTPSEQDGRWTQTFPLAAEDGQYAITATATDLAGNRGTDAATARFETRSTDANDTITVKMEPSGLFVEFTAGRSVNDTFVTMTESNVPLAPLVRGQAGVSFLNAALGQQLVDNLSYARIGIPADPETLPPRTDVGDVTIRYFNETTDEWEHVPTTVERVELADGTTGEYWVANVTHFSTYGAVAVDAAPPSIAATQPSDGHEFPAGTTAATLRVEYDDALSGVNASRVTVTFDGASVTNHANATVTSRYVEYRATGLADDSDHSLDVTVEDDAGNVRSETLSFSVAAPSGGSSDGPGGRSSPSGGSPPASGDSPETGATVATVAPLADGGFDLLVENARANRTVPGTFPAGELDAAGVGLRGLDVAFAVDGDFDFRVAVNESAPASAPALPAAAGSPLAYFEVAHPTVADSDLTNATFRFAVDRDAVADRGRLPEDVFLVRHHGGEWTPIETRLVDETDEEFVYEATSPGLSVFAVATRPDDPTTTVETTAPTTVDATATATTTTPADATTDAATTADAAVPETTAASASDADTDLDTALLVGVLAVLALAAIGVARFRRD